MKHVTLDTYVIHALMPDLVGHDRRPSAFLVYLYLWYHARQHRSRAVTVSHQQMAVDTGLSKSAVQAAVRTLVRRRLVRCDRGTRTAVPTYHVLKPWVRTATRVRPVS